MLTLLPISVRLALQPWTNVLPVLIILEFLFHIQLAEEPSRMQCGSSSMQYRKHHVQLAEEPSLKLLLVALLVLLLLIVEPTIMLTLLPISARLALQPWTNG